MSPEEWLASQTQAAPAPARAQVTDQASKDKEAVDILKQELKTAQTKSQSGDQRAQDDVKSIARELSRKGVTVDLAPAAAPAVAPAAGTPAAAPMSPEQWAASQPKMGFFESLAEQVTGRARATPETQALPEWVTMPELNQLSVAGFKTALGTLLSGPKETVQVLQANFPGVQVRQDAKGNYLLKSSVDQKEYAITPGFTMGDIPRALGGLAAFTPAGRAATIPSAIVAAGATQAAIEASQAATGGEFSPSEVAMAAATGPAGQIIQRVVPPAVQAVKTLVQRSTGPGRAPSTPGAPGAPIAPTAPRIEPTLEAPPPAVAEVAPVVPPVVAPVVAEVAEVSVGDILTLARKAGGMGPGSTAAKAKLVDLAQVNQEARAAAERLGIDLPFDVFSDNPQVRNAVGLTRALVAGEAEAAWESTMRQAIQRADNISQQFDAAFVEGRPATGLTSQNILDNLKATRDALKSNAKDIYQRIDGVEDGADGLVPKSTLINLQKLEQTLQKVMVDVGEKGLSPKEKELLELATQPGVTYGRLLREKSLIGKALNGLESPYGSMAEADLKRLYGALAQDQLDNVGTIAGEEVRRELRAANFMTAKQKALEKRIIGAFGKEIDGSVATLMQTAMTTAAKGDAASFNKLMKVVPEDLRKETLATALASVTAGKAAGRAGAGVIETVFSPTEFTKVYRGLRANPPVYSQMVKIMGPEWDRVSRDLYEISKRIADAQARIPTTGKANQILGAAAVDSLMGKVMSSSLGQSAVTGVTGMAPGGGFMAPFLVQWMSASKGAGVQKAAKLLASPEFQELAVQTATKGGEPTQAAIRRTAMSQSFQKFADQINLPKELDARVQFLQSAIQTERQADQENK